MAAKKPPASPEANPDGGAKPTDKLSCRVTSPLRHDGKRYAMGDLVDLTGSQAKRLKALGVVTDAPAEG